MVNDDAQAKVSRFLMEFMGYQALRNVLSGGKFKTKRFRESVKNTFVGWLKTRGGEWARGDDEVDRRHRPWSFSLPVIPIIRTSDRLTSEMVIVSDTMPAYVKEAALDAVHGLGFFVCRIDAFSGLTNKEIVTKLERVRDSYFPGYDFRSTRVNPSVLYSEISGDSFFAHYSGSNNRGGYRFFVTGFNAPSGLVAAINDDIDSYLRIRGGIAALREKTRAERASEHKKQNSEAFKRPTRKDWII